MLGVDTFLCDSLSFDTVRLRLTYFMYTCSLSRSQPSVKCAVILIRPTTLNRCVKQNRTQPCLFHCWPFSRGLLNSTIFFTNSKALSTFFSYFLLFWFSVIFATCFEIKTKIQWFLKMFLTLFSKRIKML